MRKILIVSLAALFLSCLGGVTLHAYQIDTTSSLGRTIVAYGNVVRYILHEKGIRNKVDKSLDAIDWANPQDPSYIADPACNWMVRTRMMPQTTRIQNNTSWSSHLVENDLSSPWKVYHSASITYRRLTLNANFSPYRSDFKDKEMTLGITAKSYVLDLYYRQSSMFGGTSTCDGTAIDISRGGIERKSLGYNFQLIFNQKRYSAQAARLQVKEQIKSAGTPLLCSSGSVTSIESPAYLIFGVPKNKTTVRSISFGGGYAYNWVPAPGWLVNASLTASLMFLGSSHINVTGLDTYVISVGFPSHYETAIAGISKSINRKWFVGAEFLCERMSYKGRTDDFLLRTTKLQGQVYAGLRF